MAVQASAMVGSPNVFRRSGDFHPPVWGNHFDVFGAGKLKFEKTGEQEVEKLKEEVKAMLIAPSENVTQKLDLIDSIQRLGVSYHFQSEIRKLLVEILDDYSVHLKTGDNGENPHNDFLLFRLARQQGLRISCDVFNKYKDSEGNFRAEIAEDLQELLSLYEAANYSLHGEDILDEALVFAKERLETMAGPSSPKVAEQVKYALKFPLRRCMPRLEARHFMPIYEERPSHSTTLLTFAKLDFNILQKLHQEEVGEVSRWWKDVSLSSKLNFARDRIVECYFWSLAAIPEPQFSTCRKIVAKVTQLTTVMDDIYDLHATYEEVQLLTDAIQRWDINMKNHLPDYLQVYYESLLNLYVDIQREFNIDGESFRMNCIRAVIKRQAKAYFGEARWFHEGITPTIDEYYEFALTTSCYPWFVGSAYLCMGDAVPDEAFAWLLKNPKIFHATNIIGRIMNDMVSNEHEQRRGHSASSIESYIKQYNVSREVAHDALKKRVEDAWKDINECSIEPREFPSFMLSPVMNYARATHVNYVEEDGYTIAARSTKHYITSLLVDPVPV